MRCCSSLQKQESTVSKKMLELVKNREKKLMHNVVLLGCVFLAPRFSFLVSEDEKKYAMDHLNKLWKEMNFVKK